MNLVLKISLIADWFIPKFQISNLGISKENLYLFLLASKTVCLDINYNNHIIQQLHFYLFPQICLSPQQIESC
jgi:hypothetical protein